MKPRLLVSPFAVLVATLCVACSTTPTQVTSALEVPSGRALAFQATSPSSANLVAVRDKGYLGSACLLAFYVNGVLAARLDVGERASFGVKAGEALLKVGWDPQGRGLCAFGSDNWTQRETVLRDGEQKVFRLTIDPNAKLDIVRAEP